MQNFNRTKCGEDSQIRKYFELGNVGRIYKSLGCLEKKPGIFCEKKNKKKKKKNARKLLKKLYYKSDPAQKYYSKVIHRKEVTHSNGQ